LWKTWLEEVEGEEAEDDVRVVEALETADGVCETRALEEVDRVGSNKAVEGVEPAVSGNRTLAPATKAWPRSKQSTLMSSGGQCGQSRATSAGVSAILRISVR
jgi:hypothetical protein